MIEEERYYFTKFSHGGQDYLLFDENGNFPACTTEKLALELCRQMFWYTELGIDFTPILLSESEAKELTGIPFKIIDFLGGSKKFLGVPIKGGIDEASNVS